MAVSALFVISVGMTFGLHRTELLTFKRANRRAGSNIHNVDGYTCGTTTLAVRLTEVEAGMALHTPGYRSFDMQFLRASALIFAMAAPAAAADLAVPMNKVSAAGVGEAIGTIVISERAPGISMKIDVTGIPPGPHGFHVHETGNCEPAVKDDTKQAALAAGGHYDPADAKSHKGPEGKGHKGDLPLLTATDKGVNAVVAADHLTLADLRGRSLMIHAGGDTYSDTPENGGGAARIACGVIPKE